MVCVYFGHNNVLKAHGLFNVFISYWNMFENKNIYGRFYFIYPPLFSSEKDKFIP